MDDIKPYDIIYLQWTGEDTYEDITWCNDLINDTDVMYTRTDKVVADMKKIMKDIELAHMFITSGEVPKLTLGLDILQKAIKGEG